RPVSTPALSSGANKCIHFASGRCGIASRIAGIPVVFDQRACAVCMQQGNPMAENKVTYDIASWAVRKMGKEKEANALNARRHAPSVHDTLNAGGVGSIFANELGWIDFTQSG